MLKSFQDIHSGSSKIENLLLAIYHWLMFEHLCKRQTLFEEKYLSYPVGHFLRSRYIKGLKHEYPHPCLKYKGIGSRSKIDYVVIDKHNPQNVNMRVALELKWLSGSSTLLIDSLADILRLSLLLNLYPRCLCCLIIVGKYSIFKSQILSNKHFHATNQKDEQFALFPMALGNKHTLLPNNLNHPFSNLINKAKANLSPTNPFPNQITIQLYAHSELYPKPNGYIALGWRISTV